MPNDYPIQECLDRVLPLVKQGAKFHQKWTCSHCGSRQTMEEENQFFESGICGECGKESPIKACNYLLILGPG